MARKQTPAFDAKAFAAALTVALTPAITAAVTQVVADFVPTASPSKVAEPVAPVTPVADAPKWVRHLECPTHGKRGKAYKACRKLFYTEDSLAAHNAWAHKA